MSPGAGAKWDLLGISGTLASVLRRMEDARLGWFKLLQPYLENEERQSAYRQLFRAQIAKADVEAIRNATNKRWVLGDSRFGAKVAALTERGAMRLPRGRPNRGVAD